MVRLSKIIMIKIFVDLLMLILDGIDRYSPLKSLLKLVRDLKSQTNELFWVGYNSIVFALIHSTPHSSGILR